MAEERTLGLARAPEPAAEEVSKEELQRRLEDVRDSISHTVTEIKETVAHQVQVVKDSLDWREQFKKRPVAWSAGAFGVGFLVGYGVAARIKGDGKETSEDDRVYSDLHSYAAQPIIGEAPSPPRHEKGPGLLKRVSTTPAYERVKDEVANVGNTFLSELSKTATQVVVPALIKSVRDFIGGHLPGTTRDARPTSSLSPGAGPSRPSAGNPSTYQPVRE
jgi:hypothetical protein